MGLLMHFGKVFQRLRLILFSNTTFRLAFHPDIDLEEIPAYNYVRSVHNISVECSWLCLRLDFGDNVVMFFNKGIKDHIYNSDNAEHL